MMVWNMINSYLRSIKKAIQFALITGVVVGFISLIFPDYYRSEAKILPLESKLNTSGFSGLAAAAANLGMTMPGGEGGDNNFTDIIGSRWVREHLLQAKFKFRIRNWRFGTVEEKSETLGQYLKIKNEDQGVRIIGEILIVSRDPKSKMITITAETKSQELSQQIVARTTGLLEQFLQERGRTRGGAKAIFAEARLGESRIELEAAETALKKFLRTNRNYQNSSDPDVRFAGARLEYEYKLKQQLLNMIALNREQALLEEKGDVPILNILDRGSIPQERSRPNRTLMVLSATLLSGVLFFMYLERKIIHGWLKK